MNANPGGTGWNRAYVAASCLIAALGGLLFGYDTAVINGAIGFLETHFGLTPAATGWAASSALLGCMLGVSFAGVFSDRMGRRKTLLLAGVLFVASSIGTAVPRTLTDFVLFRIAAGVGIGIASMASPLYIAEVAPAPWRGRLVSVNQFAIVAGMLLIYFVNFAIARAGDLQWQAAVAWRWMFASGVAPAALFLALLFAAPESPRWLIRQGQSTRAIEILRRIGGATYAETEALAIERTLAAESGSVTDLFRPGLRRVLALGVLLAVLQQVTGINVFLYFGAEIFKQFGGDVNAALLQQIVVGTANLLFTVLAIWTVDRLGRKPLMLVGATGMGICLLAMGAVAHFGQVALWVLVFIVGYIACFALSVGPVTWVLLSEIFPTGIRGRALSIATFCLWSANFLVSQTFPMMDEHPGLIARFHHGFPFYLYAGFCAVLVIVVWKLVPETKGRTLEEIESGWLAARPAADPPAVRPAYLASDKAAKT